MSVAGYVCIFGYMCICIYVYICIQHTYTCIWFVWKCTCVQLANKTQELTCLGRAHLPHQGYRWATTPGLLLGAGDLDSGPCACMAGALLSEPSSPPL